MPSIALLHLSYILYKHTIGVVRIRKALENRTNMEDDRVAVLEAQLNQAKLIAEEADKKYEEVVYLMSQRWWWAFGALTC